MTEQQQARGRGFHVRRDHNDRWHWRLTEGDKILAVSPGGYVTKGEANAAIEIVRRAIAEAEATVVDTTVAEPRWRGIDGVTGEIQSGPAPEPEETHDEGETGPPEVDGDAVPGRPDAA